MEYIWAIFVVTALTDGSGDYKYDEIAGRYASRLDCEYAINDFVKKYEPFQDNETVWCLKVDE
jgi:hypothetical protein